MPTPRFDKIKFGYAGAEEESAYEPGLLTNGFFDRKGFVHEAKAA